MIDRTTVKHNKLFVYGLLACLSCIALLGQNAPSVQTPAETPETILKQGTAYEAQGFIDRAMDAYKEALRINPQYAEGHARLGVAYARKGMLDKAIEALTQAVSISPNTDRYHYDLAVAYDRKEMFDKAIEEYQKVVKINPNYLEAFNNLGTIYNIRDRLDEAIAAYRNAIRIKPEVARIHYNLGIVYVRKGMFNHAIQEYNEAVRFDPHLAEAYNNLGVVYSQTWQFAKASEAFKKALEVKSDMREARDNLQETERDQKLVDDLIAEYKDHLAANPKDRDTWTALSIAYMRKNEANLALTALTQAQKLASTAATKTNPPANPSAPPKSVEGQTAAKPPQSAPSESTHPSVPSEKATTADTRKEARIVDLFPASKDMGAKPSAKPEEKTTRDIKAAAPRASETVAARLTPSKTGKTLQTSEPIKATGAKPFALQVGVHREREKAEEVAKTLRAKGITAQVVRADTTDRGAWYQVRVGAFTTYVEARDFGEKLKVQNVIDQFSVTRTARSEN